MDVAVGLGSGSQGGRAESAGWPFEKQPIVLARSGSPRRWEEVPAEVDYTFPVVALGGRRRTRRCSGGGVCLDIINVSDRCLPSLPHLQRASLRQSHKTAKQGLVPLLSSLIISSPQLLSLPAPVLAWPPPAPARLDCPAPPSASCPDRAQTKTLSRTPLPCHPRARRTTDTPHRGGQRPRPQPNRRRPRSALGTGPGGASLDAGEEAGLLCPEEQTGFSEKTECVALSELPCATALCDPWV